MCLFSLFQGGIFSFHHNFSVPCFSVVVASSFSAEPAERWVKKRWPASWSIPKFPRKNVNDSISTWSSLTFFATVFPTFFGRGRPALAISVKIKIKINKVFLPRYGECLPTPVGRVKLHHILWKKAKNKNNMDIWGPRVPLLGSKVGAWGNERWNSPFFVAGIRSRFLMFENHLARWYKHPGN